MTDPRRIALNVLVSWHDSPHTLTRVMDGYANDMAGMPPNDRSLCNALIFGVLRNREAIDWTIRGFSRTRMEKIELPVLYILRLALFQILYMDRIPVFAAIHTAVDLARSLSGSRATGFVNAVLRNAAENHGRLPLPDPSKDPAEAVSITHSLPLWLAKKWIKAFGLEKTRALGLRINRIPMITVRCNPLRTDRENLAQSLSLCAEHIEFTRYAQRGLRFSNPSRPIQEMEAFCNGWFHVQDEAAQIVTEILAPEPGESILDACAGLGGKTFHIAQMLRGAGEVTACDLDAEKLATLRRESLRLGLNGIETRSLDLTHTTIRDFDRYFDRVLLDAPCTGLGVLQRNPDTRWKRSLKDIHRLSSLQKKMIRSAANLVRPGGILVYAVCSCESEENEAVVQRFLDKRKDFSIDTGFHFDSYSRFLTRDGFFKTWPEADHMDGFFAARLKRRLRPETSS